MKVSPLEIECYVGEWLFEIIIDTGASTSAISRSLAEDLELSIIEESKKKVVLADGTKVKTLGRAGMKIVTKEWVEIPLEVEVMEMGERWNLIIGNDLLEKWGSIINFQDKTLEIEIEGERMIIPLYYREPYELEMRNLTRRMKNLRI